MDRRLLLLRHAKSSWDDPGIVDHERPLAPRGVQAATRLAEHFRAEAIRPALVLCSSARRTRETLASLAPALGDDVDIRVEDDLYGADDQELLRRLRAVDADVPSVMIVGHNPGLQELAVELAGDWVESAMTQLQAKFPTGALATFAIGVTPWRELAPGTAYLMSLVVPRRLQ